MSKKNRKRIVTWTKIAEFYDRSKKTVMTWRDNDPDFKKILQWELGKVFMFEDDAERYRQSRTGSYEKLARSQVRKVG